MKAISKISLLLLGVGMLSLNSCSKDDDNNDSKNNKLQNKYITVEDAVYYSGSMPKATVDEELSNVEYSDLVMNGTMNYLTVNSDNEISRFFIGIEGVDGYLEYIPKAGRANSEYTYTIPVMMSQEYSGNSVLLLSAQYSDGAVTLPGNFPLFQIDTREGDLEIKLSFSNEKDIDLHLITPSGTHVYFSNSRDGFYEGEFLGEFGVFEFGLDIDSNPSCTIDGVNKENIYIPTQFVENGIYTVLVDLYANCDSSISTDWSISARYKGELIRPIEGTNPASGTFEIGASSSYNEYPIEVMQFRISGANNVRQQIKSLKAKKIRSIFDLDLSEAALNKIKNAR